MKLALIPPIDLLDWTCETDFQLMLPHLIHDERYRYTYMSHCKDPEQYVILDNGEAEGETIAMYRLIEIAKEFAVDEVVLPDTIGDMLDTQEKSEYFMNLWYENPWPKYLHRPKLMYVVQGKSMNELQQSAAYAMEDPRVDVIGIPRHILTSLTNGKDVTNRKRLAEWIHNSVSGKPIHLLGANSTFATELRDNGVWPSSVRSTDTSSPFNYAFGKGKLLRLGTIIDRVPDYFNRHADEYRDHVVERNVTYLREWAGA